ncbi:MAG: BON domain-containing protein [Candidatus Eremiobacteraeota bacterium]|nr:BON domain-containing protein [Candidatus Eremiobacteraeota bacterium]
MKQKEAWGLVGAMFAGTAAGVMAAPRPARNELRRRAYYNLSDFARRAARVARKTLTEVRKLFEVGGQSVGGVAKNVLVTLKMGPRPITSLKQALAADPVLAHRTIWVDAHGDTILLHGLVDNDEEWRSADCLARLASPDGSVRNLLQVRRSSD